MKGKIYLVAALVAAIVSAAMWWPTRPVVQHDPVARLHGADAPLAVSLGKSPPTYSDSSSTAILASAVIGTSKRTGT